MKIKSLLLSLALSSAGLAQAQVHETPQPVPPAVAAKPHLKAQAAAKQKHTKPAKKSAARKGKKKPAKHAKSAKAHKPAVH